MCQPVFVIKYLPQGPVWNKPWTWLRKRTKPGVVSFNENGDMTFSPPDTIQTAESDPKAVLEAINNAPGFDLIAEFSPKLKEKMKCAQKNS